MAKQMQATNHLGQIERLTHYAIIDGFMGCEVERYSWQDMLYTYQQCDNLNACAERKYRYYVKPIWS